MCQNVCRAHDCSFVRLKSLFPFESTFQFPRRSLFSFEVISDKLDSLIFKTPCSSLFIDERISFRKRLFIDFFFHAHKSLNDDIRQRKRKRKSRYLMKVQNRLIYSAITFEIHLLNHHYRFRWKRRREEEEEKEENPFSASSDSSRSDFFCSEKREKKRANLIWKPEMKIPVISAFDSFILLHLRFWWFVRQPWETPGKR